MQHNSYPKEKVKEILDLFEKGFNPTEIARKLDTYNTTIRRILLRNDKILKNPSEAKTRVKGNPFLKGTSYWIGFIAGDGNIYENRVKIGLTPSDENHLKKYISYLGYDINILTDVNGKGHETKVAQFKSKKIADWFKYHRYLQTRRGFKIMVTFIQKRYLVSRKKSQDIFKRLPNPAMG